MSDSGPSAATAPIIEMTDVSFGSMRDQDTIVAEAVNWKVFSGDFWVVAGLQGSGKSDFLMFAGGIMPPNSGRYLLFGEEMPIFDDARLATRLRLGLVFDGGQLFNHLTIQENVALPLRYHQNLGKAEAANIVQPLMEALELAEWADSTPGAIGRNWQKRVGLARALAMQPEVLLIDSPVTALDLRHASWWFSFLAELSEGHALMGGRPTTLIVTAADLQPWKTRARQFAVLKDKRLTVLGSWEQLESANREILQEVYETTPQE
jgi:ABC-type transporter Mla maintaining outer membrane lipid asymmetry ATPase subunit MlaF